MTDPIFDPLRRELQGQLLRYAVGKAIFCPVHTGEVLDCSNAVLLDGSDHGLGMQVVCAAVYDEVKDTRPVAELISAKKVEVLDGREIFPVRKPKITVSHVKPEETGDPNQEVLF